MEEAVFYSKLAFKLTISLTILIIGWGLNSKKIVLGAMIYVLLVCIHVLIPIRIEIRRED